MKVERIEIDSRVCGYPVLAIQDFDPQADFSSFEREYIEEHAPGYVSSKVPLDDIARVHAMEAAGFQLIECQIRSAVKLRKPFDVSALPYEFVEVTREQDLNEVLQIAGTTFVHDRFSVDPAIAPGVSGQRYQEYVLKSFRSPQEAVYRLMDRTTGEAVAFKTHRYVSSSEVLFLIGGVRSDLKTLGLGPVSEYFEFNELIRKGVRRGITHISASNYPIFNMEIGQFGFRVLTTFAVMRKIYLASQTS